MVKIQCLSRRLPTVTLSQGNDDPQRAEFHPEVRFLACKQQFFLPIGRHELFKDDIKVACPAISSSQSNSLDETFE